jgi:N-acetylmuramoyl-L-alanine amidase
MFFSTAKPVSAADTVKIRYNGKTYQNSSVKLPVSLDEKTISKKNYKAIKIKGNYMVAYTDIFQNGLKLTCKKSGSTITISGNDNTLKLKIGSKSATLNGRKITLPVAPLSVRYVNLKKTKILVPIKTVAQNMGYTFYRSSSLIKLYSPLSLEYDGNAISYHDIQGTIYYNHSNYKLNTLPVMKLEKKYYIPAQELIESILGLDYMYSSDSGKITIENKDCNISITGYVNSNEITVNGNTVTMGAAIRLIHDQTKNQDIVCVPAAKILKQLGYTCKWDSKEYRYIIQSNLFFEWEKTLTSEQTADTSVNYLYKASCSYSGTDENGSVKMQLTGSSANLMNSLTVKRENAVITVTIPSSQYLPDKNSFSNFGEIVDKVEVTTADNIVTFSFTCKETCDYSYTVQDGILNLNILYTYSSKSTDISDYSLLISKPDGVTEASLSNVDMYPGSKAFKIMIKGNYVEYFKKNPVVINNNTVKSVTVSKNNSKTVIKVKTSKLQGYKIYVKNSKIVVKIANPNKIYKSIVVLDSGHGGYDSGATNKGTKEKDLNYKIMYTLMKPYFSDNAPDIKVYWTRTSDTYITLANRAAFAKKVNADVFISLHMNSASNASANGTEVYYSVSNNSKSFHGITSKAMANLFKNQLIGDLGTKNRGTKTAGYYVLKYNTVPSILMELGFISGSTDYSKLTSSAFQKKAAKSIYTGIVSLFNKYPTGR